MPARVVLYTPKNLSAAAMGGREFRAAIETASDPISSELA